MFSLYFGYDYSQTISSATTDAPNTFRLMEFEFVSSSFTEDTSTPHTVTTTKAAGLYDSYFRPVPRHHHDNRHTILVFQTQLQHQ